MAQAMRGRRDRGGIGPRGAEGAGLASAPIGRQEVRQHLDGAGQVVQPPMGVARGQQGRAMAGQLLQGPQVDAGASAQRQVGVP